MNDYQNAYSDGFIVTPRSKAKIDSISKAVRMLLPDCVDTHGAFDVVAAVERFNDGQSFSIVDDQDLPAQVYALTDSNGCVSIKQSVYDAASYGDPRHRFTLAHELGHAIMHKGQIGFARAAREDTKIYKNSEWQANEFAGRLLMPDESLRRYQSYGITWLCETFGISKQCLEHRLRHLQ